MKKLCGLLAGLALVFLALPAQAQTFVTNNCTLPVTWSIGSTGHPFAIDTHGATCINGSITASLSGFPTSQSTGTPIAATTGGVAGTLPTGAVVVATNVGTTTGAYCKLGASATTSDQFISPNGGWFAFTVGANTQLTCITSTSTTTVNMVGGSGLPTGTGGGGGGGGGGGAITSPLGAGTSAGAVRTTSASDDPVLAAINAGVATPGGAPPTNVIAWGALGSGATGGLSRSVINCDLHVFKHITTATDTLAVQGVASQTVFVCGATAQAAGTATFFLENTASVNANCSSSNTQIAGLTTMAANGQYGFYNPVWGGLKNTAGNGLCINSTGTGGFDLDIWYAQF